MAADVTVKFQKLSSMMKEKLKRRWAACEAMALGRGGISTVAEATGMSRATTRKGVGEVTNAYAELASQLTAVRIRQPGAGRPARSALGGSNGSRPRLWKVCLQKLADELGLKFTICHFPPGTSKWNQIEHRIFCHITENWRGCPLVSQAVIVNLIANTTTNTGLTIKAHLDKNSYPIGINVSD